MNQNNYDAHRKIKADLEREIDSTEARLQSLRAQLREVRSVIFLMEHEGKNTFEPPLGLWSWEVQDLAQRLANQEGRSVSYRFNDVEYVAAPTTQTERS